MNVHEQPHHEVKIGEGLRQPMGRVAGIEREDAQHNVIGRQPEHPPGSVFLHHEGNQDQLQSEARELICQPFAPDLHQSTDDQNQLDRQRQKNGRKENGALFHNNMERQQGTGPPVTGYLPKLCLSLRSLISVSLRLVSSGKSPRIIQS